MFIVYPSWIVHAGDKGQKLPIYSVHIQPLKKDARLATGGQDGKVRLWNMKPILDLDAEKDDSVPKLLSTLSLHSGAVMCVRWSNDKSTHLATGSDDHKIVIWEQDRSGYQVAMFGESETANVETWRGVKVLSGHESDVLDLAWSPENDYLASCGLDSHIIVWDGRTFEKLKKLDAHGGFVKGITWDPIGKFLASQSDDKTVKVWRISDWKVNSEITEPYVTTASTTFFRRLSWSPEGTYVITANGENGNIPVAPIISREDWSTELSLVGHQAPIEVALFNPVLFEVPTEDGQTALAPEKRALSAICATGSQDRGVSVWCTSKSYCAASAQDVFKHSVLDLAWTSDGYTLLACSYDGTVAAFTFSTAEFGFPISAEDKFSAMVKYGYKKETKPIPESITQLELEDVLRAKDVVRVHEMAPSTSKENLKPDHEMNSMEAPRASMPSESNISSLPVTNQKETRLADGRRRIKPMFVKSGAEPDEYSIPVGSKKEKEKRKFFGGDADTENKADSSAVLAVPSIRTRYVLQIPAKASLSAHDPSDYVTVECKNPDKPSRYRILPPIVLPACASYMDACESYLLCITCIGTGYGPEIGYDVA
ncbi:HIR complex subunit [Dinochytrium kinnereticum]|nr:HIR complex subunit [Dinochytrium kinnereticum]